MSDDRFEQEEAKDDDVESHRHKPFKANEELLATEEPGTESDDVEAHRHKPFKANEEPGSDDSDDVEAHRHKGFK
ncbi:MAG TPA: hypothetical protein VF872_06420 [Gaiellaceae bacterium]